MINTPDWENAKQRMQAMLHGERLERPCIHITCPKTPGVRVPAPRGLHDPRETDLDRLLDAFEQHIEANWYLGEAFPTVSLSFGPDTFSAYLGCDLCYTEDRFTSWALPIIKDWDDLPPLRFDPQSPWWRRMSNTLTHAAQRAQGRYLLCCPDTHAGGDALAAMRGQQNLCLDLVDRPERVKAAMVRIEAAVIPYFEHVFGILDEYQEGSPCMGCWMPAHACVVQCDFIALISTTMMEEFFLKEMTTETEVLDNCFFHLDGPDAIRHMDRILELPELGGLNYVVGSGQQFSLDHTIELYRRVQEAGKIAVLGASQQTLKPLIEQLDPARLCLRMNAGSPEEAEGILREAKRLTSARG